MALTVSPQMIEDARAEVERLLEGVTAAEEALGRASAATVTARASLDSLDEEISAQSALVSAHDLEQSRLSGLVVTAESRLAAARSELDRQRAALARAEERRDLARDELLALEGNDDAVREDDSLEAAVLAADQNVETLRAEVETLRDELHASERERDALAARTGALSLALDQRDGSGAVEGAPESGASSRATSR